MTKLEEDRRKPVSLFNFARRMGLYDIEPYDRLASPSANEVRDNVKLKGFLKRAVEKDVAPQYLIDEIKFGIRR